MLFNLFTLRFSFNELTYSALTNYVQVTHRLVDSFFIDRKCINNNLLKTTITHWTNQLF